MMNRPLDTTSRTFDNKLEVPHGKKSNSTPRPGHTGIPFHCLDGIIPAVSARTLKASSEELDEVIHSSLQEILLSLGLERGGLLKVAEESCNVAISHAWNDHGVKAVSNEINFAQALPWTYYQVVVLGKTVAKYGVDFMPADAETDRQFFGRLGIQSALAIPLFIDQRVLHIMMVHSLKEKCI